MSRPEAHAPGGVRGETRVHAGATLSASSATQAALDSARLRFLASLQARLARIIELICSWRDRRGAKSLEAGQLSCELDNLASLATTLGFDALAHAAQKLQHRIWQCRSGGEDPSVLLDDPLLDRVVSEGMQAPTSRANPLRERSLRCSRVGDARVLLVSSDADLLQTMAGLLGLAGFDVVGLGDPQRLTETLQALAPALVIVDLDVTLSPEDAGCGLGWLEALRELKPLGLASCPAHWKTSVFRAGVSELIDKAAPIDTLIEAIDRQLMRRSITHPSTPDHAQGHEPDRAGDAPPACC